MGKNSDFTEESAKEQSKAEEVDEDDEELFDNSEFESEEEEYLLGKKRRVYTDGEKAHIASKRESYKVPDDFNELFEEFMDDVIMGAEGKIDAYMEEFSTVMAQKLNMRYGDKIKSSFIRRERQKKRERLERRKQKEKQSKKKQPKNKKNSAAATSTSASASADNDADADLDTFSDYVAGEVYSSTDEETATWRKAGKLRPLDTATLWRARQIELNTGLTEPEILPEKPKRKPKRKNSKDKENKNKKGKAGSSKSTSTGISDSEDADDNNSSYEEDEEPTPPPKKRRVRKSRLEKIPEEENDEEVDDENIPPTPKGKGGKKGAKTPAKNAKTSTNEKPKASGAKIRLPRGKIGN